MFKARKNFTLNGVAYEVGDGVKIESKEQLAKLNELGFIEPLTIKQIQNFSNKKKEEEE